MASIALRESARIACPTCGRSVLSLPAASIYRGGRTIGRFAVGVHAPAPAPKRGATLEQKRVAGYLICPGSQNVVTYGGPAEVVNRVKCGWKSKRKPAPDHSFGSCPSCSGELRPKEEKPVEVAHG